MEKEQVINNTLDVNLKMLKEYWNAQGFLSYQWWFLVILTIIPWIIWWKFTDKKRLMEILSFGLLIMFFSALFVPLVRNLNFVQFIHRIHWSLRTPLYPYEISIFPVSFMFIYQFSKNWLSYFIGTFLMISFWVSFFIPFLIKFEFITISSKWIFALLLLSLATISRWLMHHFLQKGNIVS